MKEENKTSRDFTYQYKAHNDFIETTTETGIFGGFLFIGIFLLTALAFLQALFKDKSTELQKALFLPVFGLLCYGADAFFNFPQDRPEIQALFALYTGIAVAFTSYSSEIGKGNTQNSKSGKAFLLNQIKKILRKPDLLALPERSGHHWIRCLLIISFGLLLTVTVGILYLNFASLRLQQIIKAEVNRGKLISPASLFLNGFPVIPNLNVVGEPIAVQKARYLINEHRYDEAVIMLKNDQSSPSDARIGYFLAFSYYHLQEYAKSNRDLDFLITSGDKRSNLFNLRGVNYKNLGNNDEACKNFKVAAELGDKDGLNNYPKLCNPK